MLCTYVNSGTRFTFDSKTITQHPFRDRRVSTFEVHGELALEAMDRGEAAMTFLVNSQGAVMDAKSIKNYIKFLREQNTPRSSR